MERKFHDRFYNRDNEAKLSDLISVRQDQDEPALDYFRRFKDIKNRCLNLTVSEKKLADLVFDGLRSYLKKELEGFEYYTINYLHMKVLGLEFRLQSAKDAHNTHRSIHVDCKSDSNDEKKEAYVAEFIWPSDAKPCSCSSLKSIPRIGKNKLVSLLMFLSVIVYLMNCLEAETSSCLMSYRRLRS